MTSLLLKGHTQEVSPFHKGLENAHKIISFLRKIVEANSAEKLYRPGPDKLRKLYREMWFAFI